MSKPRTEENLSQQLVEDRTWRIREISDLKSAISRADLIQKRVLLRALVTICYAHWEGYVRFVARKYLEHIALRQFRFSELNRQFLRNYFLPRLSSLTLSKGSVTELCALIDDIFDAENLRFSRVNQDLVNTRSNLNMDVFSDICKICGLPVESYQDEGTFIDVMLLKRRNAIAHGEDTFIGEDDSDELVNKTIQLMRSFADALENNIYLKNYRSVA